MPIKPVNWEKSVVSILRSLRNLSGSINHFNQQISTSSEQRLLREKLEQKQIQWVAGFLLLPVQGRFLRRKKIEESLYLSG